MNQAPDLITAYAQNLNLAARYQQRGQAIPQQLQQQIAHIEQVAQVQLNPAQLQNAMEHVSRIRLADNETYNQHYQQAGNEYNRIKQDRAFESASSGLSPEGLFVSPEQMAQAHNNSGKFTVKNNQKMDLEGLDKYTRKKFGVSLNTFEERQANLLDVSLKGDTERTEKMRKSYKISKPEMDAYAKNGFEFHWNKRQTENAIAAGEPDEYESQMSDSAMRKTDIMIAMSSGHGEQVYDSGIDESYLDEDNSCDRQRDVAMAFDAVEHEEINEEVHNSMGLGE